MTNRYFIKCTKCGALEYFEDDSSQEKKEGFLCVTCDTVTGQPTKQEIEEDSLDFVITKLIEDLDLNFNLGSIIQCVVFSTSDTDISLRIEKLKDAEWHLKREIMRLEMKKF